MSLTCDITSFVDTSFPGLTFLDFYRKSAIGRSLPPGVRLLVIDSRWLLVYSNFRPGRDQLSSVLLGQYSLGNQHRKPTLELRF